MADIEAGAATPKAPAPASRSRKVAASAASALCRVLALASRAAGYSLLAALWGTYAVDGARMAARLVCARDSHAAAGLEELRNTAFAAMALLFLALSFVAAAMVLLAALLHFLLFWRHGSRVAAKAREVARKKGQPESDGSCDRESCFCGPVTTPILVVLYTVVTVGALMVVLAKKACEAVVGSMLLDIGSFLICVMFCFVFSPKVTKRLVAAMAMLLNIWVTLTSLCIDVLSVLLAWGFSAFSFLNFIVILNNSLGPCSCWSDQYQLRYATLLGGRFLVAVVTDDN